jgi:hypothetical protein
VILNGPRKLGDEFGLTGTKEVRCGYLRTTIEATNDAVALVLAIFAAERPKQIAARISHEMVGVGVFARGELVIGEGAPRRSPVRAPADDAMGRWGLRTFGHVERSFRVHHGSRHETFLPRLKLKIVHEVPSGFARGSAAY